MKKFVFIGLALALIFSPSCATQVPTESYVAVIKIWAYELYAEYEINEVAADQKYKDRALEVTGIIISIGKALFDDPYIILGSGQQYEILGIQAMIPDEFDVAQLLPGQLVAVRGICKGKFIINVLLDSCYRVNVQ